MDVEEFRLGYGYRGTTQRGYNVCDGKLKWGYIGREQFDFVDGGKYTVRHENPAMSLHKGAVGVLVGLRRIEDSKQRRYLAVLKCCGKRFFVDPAALVPYDGEITEEHLRLITPLKKKVHLAENGKCACKCDTSSRTNSPTLDYDDFVAVPQNKRCTNCNGIVRGWNRHASRPEA